MNTNMMRKIRKERGLTLKELAEKTHISFSAISMYERGEIDPSSEKLQKIAEELGVSMETLLGKVAFPQAEIDARTEEEKSVCRALMIIEKQQDTIANQNNLLSEQQKTISTLVGIMGREK